MALLVLVIGLVVFALLAMRFGSDSRDGFMAIARGSSEFIRQRSDPSYDEALARQIQEARQRRYVGGRLVDAQFTRRSGELERAA